MREKKKSVWSKKGTGQEGLKKRDGNRGERWQGESRKGYLKSGIDGYVPPEGENCIRIVQPLEVEDLEYYGFEVHFHRNVGEDGGMMLCSKRMHKTFQEAYPEEEVPFNRNCTECAKQTAELWENNPDEAKSYYPDWRILMWVLDLNGDDPDKLLLWSCPKSLAEEVLAQSHKKGTEVYIDLSHPETGVKVFFDREGQGKTGTSYSGVQVSSDEYPLDDSIAEQLKMFKDLLIYPGEEDDPYESDADDTEEEGTEHQDDESTESKPDCYSKEYDKYEDCDTCDCADDCRDDYKKKESQAKPSKPTRKPRREEEKKVAEEAPKDKVSTNVRETMRRRREEAAAKTNNNRRPR